MFLIIISSESIVFMIILFEVACKLSRFCEVAYESNEFGPHSLNQWRRNETQLLFAAVINSVNNKSHTWNRPRETRKERLGRRSAWNVSIEEITERSLVPVSFAYMQISSALWLVAKYELKQYQFSSVRSLKLTNWVLTYFLEI